MPRGRVSAVRSRIMAAIRGKDTKPEMAVRRAIHAAGLRYRLHHRELPGSPDVVLTRLKTVVFVHGCFWHAHDCQPRALPKTRRAFWRAKLEANVARDERVRYFLRAAGWHVHVIWECELKRAAPLRRLVRTLVSRRLALGLLLWAWPLGAQDAMTLSCPATVVRGEIARCTIEPAATRETVVGWRFRPVTGSPLTRGAEAASAEWYGPVVISGTVEARVRVGAREDTLTARIDVLPRDWRAYRAVERVREVPASQLPIHPRRMSDLGATTLSASVMLPELERAAAQVREGPNAGLWYLTGVPVVADASVDINRPALSAGSEFWTRHGAAAARRAGVRTCSRAELTGEITRVVEAHEGLRGRADADSHAARFFESLDADLVPRIESYVEAEGDFRGLAQLVDLFTRAAGARSQQMDVDGSNRSVAPCQPRWY